MEKGSSVASYEIMFLLLMKAGPAYGYELANRFSRMTDDHIKVSYGTIYPFLRRMERRGILRSKKDETTGRVYYKLTGQGREAQRQLSRRIRESREEWEEKLLGFLVLHGQVFGRKALNNLLKEHFLYLDRASIGKHSKSDGA
jgi:DNA-binding PadR family transcriptional regulator